MHERTHDSRSRLCALAILTSLILAGCVQGEPEPDSTDDSPSTSTTPSVPTSGCAQNGAACEPPAPPTDKATGLLLRVSNCTNVGHTLDIPNAAFDADYPPGTRAANSAAAVVLIETFICEQAISESSVVSPFYASFLGAGIDPPGPTAQDAGQTFVGFELVTNHPELAQAGRGAGWQVFEKGPFALDHPAPASQEEATPYELRVPETESLYTFRGSMWSKTSDASSVSAKLWYYSLAGDQRHLLKLDYVGSVAAVSQPASAQFADESYWTATAPSAVWEAFNSYRFDTSGTISLEAIPEF